MGRHLGCEHPPNPRQRGLQMSPCSFWQSLEWGIDKPGVTLVRTSLWAFLPPPPSTPINVLQPTHIPTHTRLNSFPPEGVSAVSITELCQIWGLSPD